MAPPVREASLNPSRTPSPVHPAHAGSASDLACEVVPAQPGTVGDAIAADGRARFGFLPRFRQANRARIGLDPVLGRIGALEVRLATTPKDVRRAQRLRFNVFYEEMSAKPNGARCCRGATATIIDAFCDHLLVLDHAVGRSRSGPRGRRSSAPIGCCARTWPSGTAASTRAASTTSAPLIAAHPDLRFLELGRSCVLKPYRNKRTVELLWHGIWTYVLHHRIDVMFGCASLEGTDPSTLAASAELSAPLCAARGRLARPGAAWALVADGPARQGRDRSQSGAAGVAAAHQRLSAPRRDLRRRRGRRPAIRHHRRACDVAGRRRSTRAISTISGRSRLARRLRGPFACFSERPQSLAVGRIAQRGLQVPP